MSTAGAVLDDDQRVETTEQHRVHVEEVDCEDAAGMRQKLVSIGDDYWIENDQGERVFKVDGKALRVRQTLIFG